MRQQQKQTNTHPQHTKSTQIIQPTQTKKEYNPKGPNQIKYVEYLNDPNTDIVLGVGPAGSGKTLFACFTAINELKKGNIQKIIMTRPLVSVDEEELGYLPGDLVSKMDPWTRPIFDILLEFYSQLEINNMVYNKVIEISPLAYMRGRTFNNAFIIADEMQNSSPNQMLMMTTRIGKGTKLVITGDIKQSDRTEKNGLSDFMTKIKNYNNYLTITNTTNITNNNIQLVELTNADIERSPIVVKILDMYHNQYNNSNTECSGKPSQSVVFVEPEVKQTLPNTTQRQIDTIIRPKKIFDNYVRGFEAEVNTINSKDSLSSKEFIKSSKKPFDDCALIPKDKIDY